MTQSLFIKVCCRSRRGVGGLILALAVLGSSNCARQPNPSTLTGPNDPQRTLVKIGAEDFTAARFDAFLRERFPESPSPAPHNDQVLSELLDQAIDERLFLQAAKRQGLSVSDKEVQEYLSNSALIQSKPQDRWSAEEQRRRADRSREILVVNKYIQSTTETSQSITSAMMKKYYDEHPEAFQQPDQYHVAEILVKDEPIAEAVLRLLARGKSFESLAQKYSRNDLASQGGDLGWFARGELPEQFEKVVMALKPGAHSSAVQTDYGYHIFKLKEVRKGGTVPFTQARRQIQKLLEQAQRKQVLTQEIAKLRKATSIAVELQNLGFRYQTKRNEN